MARPVRIRVAGGWYHITIRGHNRERIFVDRRDYLRFLEKVELMREQYGVRVYAYCLMPNHYHLLIGTPMGNVSDAIRWLNGGYGIWFNRRHDREGHVFGERFKSVLVENSVWGLEVSVYIHMNPVVTEGIGYGKQRRRAEGRGMSRPPTAEERERRLRVLREYEWSSYRAYAGYTGSPLWLDRDALLMRAGKEREKSYRVLVEDRIRQGNEEGVKEKVRWGLVLGAERFAKKVRGRIRVNREHQGQGVLRKRWTFEELVKAVERIRGQRWAEFRDRYGDWGRDMVLWLGRRHGGLTLKDLGERAGGMDYSAVAMALRRIEVRRQNDRRLRKITSRLEKQCAM